MSFRAVSTFCRSRGCFGSQAPQAGMAHAAVDKAGRGEHWVAEGKAAAGSQAGQAAPWHSGPTGPPGAWREASLEETNQLWPRHHPTADTGRGRVLHSCSAESSVRAGLLPQSGCEGPFPCLRRAAARRLAGGPLGEVFHRPQAAGFFGASLVSVFPMNDERRRDSATPARGLAWPTPVTMTPVR